MGFRIRRKGTNCEVGGCDGVVRIRGLCGKHGMALRRYGNVFGGKVDRVGVCKGCGKEFRLIKSDQQYCSNVCYKKSPEGRKAAYSATKAYRARNKEKVNDIVIGVDGNQYECVGRYIGNSPESIKSMAFSKHNENNLPEL